MKNLELKDKILIGILLLAVIGVIIYKVVDNIKHDNQKDINTDIVIVNDPSRFFVVSSCIDKFYRYVSIKDIDSVYKIVSEDYVKDNDLSKNNILDIFISLDGNYNFSARKMYQQQLSDSVYKYYVYYTYNEELMDAVGETYEGYIIVYLYTDNMTYSIEPYNGEMFEG